MTRRGPKSGAAYMYERQGDTWKAVSKLTPDDASADAMFGVTVAIDGDIAAVGDQIRDHGAIYVFVRQDRRVGAIQQLTVRRRIPVIILPPPLHFPVRICWPGHLGRARPAVKPALSMCLRFMKNSQVPMRCKHFWRAIPRPGLILAAALRLTAIPL